MNRKFTTPAAARSKIVQLSCGLVPLLALSLGLASCGKNAEQERDETRKADENPGLLASVFDTKTKVSVPAGTVFTVALNHTLSSDNNASGEGIDGQVVGGMVSDNKVVVADGAQAHGVITAVEESGRVKGRASMAMEITSIRTVDGWKNVTGTMVAGVLVAPGTKKRDAATIGGAAAAGAVLGEIIGDRPGLGAAIGGAAGTGVVLTTKGKELELPAGTRIEFRLQAPLEVEVSARERAAAD
jgi:hypothetical protein